MEMMLGTVLLADDSGEIRSLIGRGLRSHGYRVLEAADGREALEVAAHYPGFIDLLVTDVQMPELDGPTLYLSLQESRPGMKVLYVSGSTNQELAQEHAFLPKPFTIAQLLSAMERSLPPALSSRGARCQ